MPQNAAGCRIEPPVSVPIESAAIPAARHAAAPPLLPPGTVLVSASKGLETGTLRRMSQVITEETAHSRPVVVLSGPSFAVEVARGLPTAVVAASSDPEAAAR